MTKTLSVLALAVAVLIVAVALLVVDTEKVRARSTCSSGTQKFTHVCIEKSAQAGGANGGWYGAAEMCAQLHRRVPTSAELNGFRLQPGITLAGNEWTSDLTSSTAVITIDDVGNLNEASPSSDVRPWRCVA